MENFTRKQIGIFFAFILVLFAMLYGLYMLMGVGKTQEVKKTNEIILYYGDGCSHCKNVDDFLASHQEIEKMMPLQRKEVYNDKKNSADLEQKALICKHDVTKGIPVPFLYFKGQCVIGDTPIIDFLQKQIQ